jgi:hypothetical protein
MNIARDGQGNVIVGLEDLDGGNNELWITVSESELLAALAVTKVKTVSQD